MTKLNQDAIDALRNGQQQLDQDGVIVGVSRQALDEVLAMLDTQRNTVIEECAQILEGSELYHRAATKFELPGFNEAFFAANRPLKWSEPYSLTEAAEAIRALKSPAHILYEQDDTDAPSCIKDSNGDIVLGLCRVCNAGEIELEEPCIPKW